MLITAEEYQPFPQELYGHGLHVAVSPLLLDEHNPAHQFRTLNQLHIVGAKQHALQRGCLDALLQSRTRGIMGATEGVLFVVRGQNLDRPSHCVWDDVASVVARLAGGACALTGRELRLPDVLAADEAFIAGTACGVIGVVRVDGADVGAGTEGPVTRRVRDAYLQLARGAGMG